MCLKSLIVLWENLYSAKYEQNLRLNFVIELKTDGLSLESLHFEGVTNMRDINKLVKWYFCALNDLDSIKICLEEMALKGWMLEDIHLRRLKFRRCQPQRIFYTVKAFDRSLASDSGITNANREFVKTCEAVDWHFVSSRGKIQIFCTTNENAVAIQTDPKIELKFINKSMLKRNCSYIPLILILSFDFFVLFGFRSLKLYTDPNTVTLACLWSFTIEVYLVQIIDHIIWYKSAKRAIVKGMEIPMQSYGLMIFTMIFWAIILVVLVIVSIFFENYFFLISIPIILVLVIALVMLNLKVKKIVKTKMSKYVFPFLFLLTVSMVPMLQGIFGLAGIFGVGHQGMHFVSFSTVGGKGFSTAYNDPLPLTLQDLDVTTNGTFSKERDDMGKFLAQETDYTDNSPIDSNSPSISYSIYITKYRWVYSKITDYYLSGNALEYWRFPNYRVISVNGANKVCASVVSENNKTSDYNYLVLYSDEIVFLQSSFEMKNGQIATCVEKLKKYFSPNKITVKK